MPVGTLLSADLGEGRLDVWGLQSTGSASAGGRSLHRMTACSRSDTSLLYIPLNSNSLISLTPPAPSASALAASLCARCREINTPSVHGAKHEGADLMNQSAIIINQQSSRLLCKAYE